VGPLINYEGRGDSVRRRGHTSGSPTRGPEAKASVRWVPGTSPALPGLALLGAKVVGLLVRNVVLTRDEIDGLMAGLLVSSNPPLGKTRLGDWLEVHAGTVGKRYASELKRHYG